MEEKRKRGEEKMLLVDRPTVLLERAEEAEAVALQPDHAPSQVTWRGKVMEVVRGGGPERIVTPWWEVTERGKAVRSVTRDYYKVQTKDGQWLWVYREVGATGGGRWFVQGVW